MAIPKIPFIAAIYTRQSRDKGDEFSSCDAQFEICKAFLVSQGWIWCGTRYDDQGESGESLDRPGLNRLLSDLQRGLITGIVVHRLDRLSRRLSDSAALLSKLRDLGIRLAVVDDPQLGTSATDMLVLNIIGSFAEFEHEMIRDRLADSRAAMKRKGLRVAGRVPYGYSTDPVTKQFVLVVQEAKRVRAIFGWASDGKKLSEIAEIANRRGWKTRSSNRHPKGGRWTPRQVAELLANPVYVGKIRVKAGTAPGKHEALIDQDLFDRVRDVVASRRVHNGPRKPPSKGWPLRGLVICARCERPMNTSVLHHKQRRYHYYRCRSNAGGRPPCKGVSVPAYQLEQLVCAQLSAVKPDKFRLPSRRQLFADLAPLWAELDDRERVSALPKVVKRVEFDPDKNRLRLSFHSGAVGVVSGILAARRPDAR